MRILQISSARTLGGGERHVVDLSNALASRGHDLHFAISPHSPLAEHLTALPEENVVRLRLRNAIDLISARSLSRLVREREIEIVHAHMARDYPLAAFATKRNPRAHLILTRHVLFPLNKLHTLTLAHTSRVIAVSRAVADRLQTEDIFPANKIRVVPNGIDFRRFEQSMKNFRRSDFFESLGIPVTRRLVGTVGTINRLKGHEEFLRAAAIIARQVADVDFVIAGEDASRKGENRARLTHLIKELGLEKRAHLLGRLGDVAPLLCALDVFVSASRTESFGLAVAEAMACGAPVVATATEGAREVIGDAATGVLVPIGSVEALAKATADLMSDPARRSRLSALARMTVRERFSLERMIAQTERVYREALKWRAVGSRH